MHSLAKMLQSSAREHATETLLTCRQGTELSHVAVAEFERHVHAWARFLLEHNVGAGDRVGIISPKSPHQLRAFYACWWIGSIAVPICEGLGDVETVFIIRDSEPTLMLVDSSVRSKVEANCGDVPLVSFDELPFELDGTPVPDLCDIDDDEPAALIYTSGSTGMPKGVMLTHKNLHVNATSALEAVDIQNTDCIMSLLPYWHSFALVVEVIMGVMVGANLVIPVDKRDFRRNIKLYRPTILLVVPRIADALQTGIEKGVAAASAGVRALYSQAMNNAAKVFTTGPELAGGVLRQIVHRIFYDPVVFRGIRAKFGGRVRMIVSGGAPLDLKHQTFFKRLGMPVYQGYGLTESAPAISMNQPDAHRLGSSGQLLSWLRPQKGGDYALKAEDGTVGKDREGELLVKGDCVMKGYWRHADASAKTLSDGWLHTGDLARIDPEGFLFIEGRRGNMIVLAGGEKLHPEHVEDAVRTCELITEAVVIGDSCKNVYVCVNVDQEQAKEIPEPDLLPTLRARIAAKTEHLASYQRPKDVLVLPDLTPDDGTLTATLKVRRHKLWERDGDRITVFLKSCGEDHPTRQPPASTVSPTEKGSAGEVP